MRCALRPSVRKWAKANGYEAEVRAYPATGGDGQEIPITKTDPVALGVRFVGNGNGSARA